MVNAAAEPRHRSARRRASCRGGRPGEPPKARVNGTVRSALHAIMDVIRRDERGRRRDAVILVSAADGAHRSTLLFLGGHGVSTILSTGRATRPTSQVCAR